jgi:hypothetical protein
MYRQELDACVYVVSKGRPENVLSMTEKIGSATWLVESADGTGDDIARYRDCADTFSKETKPKIIDLTDNSKFGSLTGARRLAMILAWKEDKPCIQLDDDLRRIVTFKELPDRTSKGKKKYVRVTIPFMKACHILLDELYASGFYLGGFRPTDNIIGYEDRNRITNTGFIIFSFAVILPCRLLCAEYPTLKEDYHYTAQHIWRYGGVVRVNNIAPIFAHYVPGGCFIDRTDMKSRECAEFLMQYWPGCFRPNTRRKNYNIGELIFQWPKGKKLHELERAKGVTKWIPGKGAV